VVPVGDGSGVELDDLLERQRVAGGVDGGGGVVGCGGQPPQVDVDVGRVEPVAFVGAGNGLGTDGFGEGLS